jgi:predicted flap endonuclease-1-like 5' DNA nuclease
VPGTASPPSSGGSPQTLVSGTAVVSAEARALHLANQLAQVRHDLAAAHADLRNVRSERDSLRAELARTRTRVEELEVELAGSAFKEPVPAVDLDLEQKLRGRINELEAALANARASVSAPPLLVDLKLVRGIGPKIEKLLKNHGVTKVADIAAWTDEDVERFAKKIGVNSARIRKDDWVGSAKRLVEGTSG